MIQRHCLPLAHDSVCQCVWSIGFRRDVLNIIAQEENTTHSEGELKNHYDGFLGSSGLGGGGGVPILHWCVQRKLSDIGSIRALLICADPGGI